MTHTYKMLERKCDIEDCDKPLYARGLCTTHYSRMRRHGDASVVLRRGKSKAPVQTRFNDKYQVLENGCWEWVAAKSSGYGVIRIDGKNVRAHIYAWEFSNGSKVPEGLHLDHYLFPQKCIGPSCCNPDHVRPVTPIENWLRSDTAPPSINARKTHCPRGHLLDGDNIIRRPSKNGRECRQCAQIFQKVRNQRYKERHGRK